MKIEDEIEYEAPYMDGLQFIFNQPEFASASQSNQSLALTENKNLLRVILPDKLTESGVHVIIGKENKSETIQNYSVVISQYGVPGEALGCIAVIGPTRMQYARSIASVDYLAEVLTGLMAWLYGRKIMPESENEYELHDKGGERMIPQEPEAKKPEAKEEQVSELTPDFIKLLADTQRKADDYLDSWKRAQADFINYKRHAEQEKMEMGVYANTQLILSLLPVLDDFERAVDSLTPKLAKMDWVHGIRLVERKLRTVLQAQGVTPIKAVGEVFDPNLHEAVMHVSGEDGKVVRELQKGYRLHDKILRPSAVAVGNGEPVIAEQAEEPETAKEKETKTGIISRDNNDI